MCCDDLMSRSFPLALPPPSGDLALLSKHMLQQACELSRQSPRRRIIAPFHKSDADPLHRMLNIAQPDSYVRPHRHLDPPKAEAWVLLAGALLFFTFNDEGSIARCVKAEAGGDVFGVDLVPGIFHSFVALRPDTVVYEVKSGPYTASNDKTFPAWAPAEGTPEAATYLSGLLAHAEREGVL